MVWANSLGTAGHSSTRRHPLSMGRTPRRPPGASPARGPSLRAAGSGPPRHSFLGTSVQRVGRARRLATSQIVPRSVVLPFVCHHRPGLSGHPSLPDRCVCFRTFRSVESLLPHGVFFREWPVMLLNQNAARGSLSGVLHGSIPARALSPSTAPAWAVTCHPPPRLPALPPTPRAPSRALAETLCRPGRRLHPRCPHGFFPPLSLGLCLK